MSAPGTPHPIAVSHPQNGGSASQSPAAPAGPHGSHQPSLQSQWGTPTLSSAAPRPPPQQQNQPQQAVDQNSQLQSSVNYMLNLQQLPQQLSMAASPQTQAQLPSALSPQSLQAQLTQASRGLVAPFQPIGNSQMLGLNTQTAHSILGGGPQPWLQQLKASVDLQTALQLQINSLWTSLLQSGLSVDQISLLVGSTGSPLSQNPLVQQFGVRSNFPPHNENLSIAAQLQGFMASQTPEQNQDLAAMQAAIARQQQSSGTSSPQVDPNMSPQSNFAPKSLSDTSQNQQQSPRTKGEPSSQTAQPTNFQHYSQPRSPQSGSLADSHMTPPNGSNLGSLVGSQPQPGPKLEQRHGSPVGAQIGSQPGQQHSSHKDFQGLSRADSQSQADRQIGQNLGSQLGSQPGSIIALPLGTQSRAEPLSSSLPVPLLSSFSIVPPGFQNFSGSKSSASERSPSRSQSYESDSAEVLTLTPQNDTSSDSFALPISLRPTQLSIPLNANPSQQLAQPSTGMSQNLSMRNVDEPSSVGKMERPNGRLRTTNRVDNLNSQEDPLHHSRDMSIMVSDPSYSPKSENPASNPIKDEATQTSKNPPSKREQKKNFFARFVEVNPAVKSPWSQHRIGRPPKNARGKRGTRPGRVQFDRDLTPETDAPSDVATGPDAETSPEADVGHIQKTDDESVNAKPPDLPIVLSKPRGKKRGPKPGSHHGPTPDEILEESKSRRGVRAMERRRRDSRGMRQEEVYAKEEPAESSFGSKVPPPVQPQSVSSSSESDTVTKPILKRSKPEAAEAVVTPKPPVKRGRRSYKEDEHDVVAAARLSGAPPPVMPLNARVQSETDENYEGDSEESASSSDSSYSDKWPKRKTVRKRAKISSPEEPSNSDSEESKSKQQKNSFTILKDGNVQCTICSRTFESVRAVRRHILYHTTPGRHNCDKCGRNFMRRDVFAKHQAICQNNTNS